MTEERKHCSFCEKSQDVVNKMIMGQNGEAGICNECVGLCCDILIQETEGELVCSLEALAKYFKARQRAHQLKEAK